MVDAKCPNRAIVISFWEFRQLLKEQTEHEQQAAIEAYNWNLHHASHLNWARFVRILCYDHLSPPLVAARKIQLSYSWVMSVVPTIPGRSNGWIC